MPFQRPKVFISYSHDSREHAKCVLGLAERLRKDGIDAQLDQYVAGADLEGCLMTLLIYHAKSRTLKFVPVFFDGSDGQLIPEPISGHTHYLLDS